jgi:hypothetical protein
MAARPLNGRLLEDLGTVLNAMPGVFSTPQWGGRAYKLPGSGGHRAKRPRLVAFVAPTGDGRAVTVSFKLEPRRAADVIEEHDWIEPHSFRTLAPSGWVTAILTTKRQAAALRRLLLESHALHAPPEPPPPPPAPPRASAPSAAADGGRGASRIDAVMADARARGWSPPAERADLDDWPRDARS